MNKTHSCSPAYGFLGGHMGRTETSLTQHALEQVAEIRFYRALHHAFTHHVGLLPASLEMFYVGVIVDLACGPGFWVRDIAAVYPDREVVGLDNDAELIACARGLTPATLKGVQFVRENIIDPVFRGPCADLLHIRLLAPMVAPDEWEELLAQLLCLCHANGMMVWTETQLETTSPAWNELYALLSLAVGKGESNSPRTLTADVTPLMERLLMETGFKHVQRFVCKIDVSFGSPHHTLLCRHRIEVMSLIQPFLHARQVASRDEIERLCREALSALENKTVKGCLSIVTFVGKIAD